MDGMRIGHLPLAVMENWHVSVRVFVCVYMRMLAHVFFSHYFFKCDSDCFFYLSIQQRVNTNCLSAKMKDA